MMKMMMIEFVSFTIGTYGSPIEKYCDIVTIGISFCYTTGQHLVLIVLVE